VRIEPFRGYRYRPARAAGIDECGPGAGADVGDQCPGGALDVSEVVAPPYDQIGPAMQDVLYGMSAANIVRVTLPKDPTEGEGGGDRYAAARQTLDGWMATRTWGEEERAAIYPYTQTYRVGGHEVTRAGFIALGEVSEYGRGIVRPHERTHAEPKADRLRLLEATGADTGLLFMLVSDPDGALRAATAPGGAPIVEARDLKGERHRVWRVDAPAVIARVQALMADRTVVIADGHHRYETAVAYARERPAAALKLMAFFALEAPGLTIFPNHRLVRDVPGFALPRLLESARRWFEIGALDDPPAFRATPPTLGVVTAAGAATLTLRRDGAAAIPWPASTSAAWRGLSVSILHEGVLRPLLGITDAMLEARSHVEYTADQAEAIAVARAGGCQAAFLIAPTTPAELLAVVRGGEILPQKSTHFYPKLLDGLVFHRLPA
jgi:uncharacterized protein (DUF1015 family)